MKRLVPISVFVLAALLLSITPLAASAQAGPTTIYVVQPGDTAYSIATRHCMTVQQLTNLNGAVISNPNQIYPGMQLRVVNQCGGSPGGGSGCSGYNCGTSGGGSGCTGYNCGTSGGSGPYYCSGYSTGVYDRGPTLHARGWVSGNIYTVAFGDTSWSISQRFGISVNALCQANGINPWFIWGGQRLVIPGLNSGNPCPPQPCPPYYPGGGCVPVYPTVIPITPVPTAPTPVQSKITITSPAANATLPPTFTVTGTGQGLFEGTVVVSAVSSYGLLLAQVPVTLQGTNVGAGGPGTFSVQMTVNVAQPTTGSIVASAPQSPNAQPVSVPVTFSPGGSGGVTYHEYQGQQCKVAILVGQPYYADVGGAPLGTFANPGTYTASRGAKSANQQMWFFIGPVPGSTPNVWVPITSVGSLTPACWW
jgi:LysM repeat protein